MEYILHPWNPTKRLNNTQLRRDLLIYRPIVKGYKTVRLCKDIIYDEIINDACSKNMTYGNYLGLAAAHGPEIYTALNQSIKKRFDTCQLGWKDYHVISDYMPYVNEAYRNSRDIEFAVHHKDMLDYMQETSEKYGIIDFDSMKMLNHNTIDKLAHGLKNCGGLKVVLAVWHTSNRKKGEGEKAIIAKYRPELKEKIQDIAGYYIHQWDVMSYHEPQPPSVHAHPMRVEVARLWKKESKAV